VPGRSTGRRPKPTHLKLITGNPGLRPLNDAEAMPDPGMPDPPPGLGVVAQLEWDHISKKLHAAGLLTMIDGSALAAYCQAFERWRQAEAVLKDLADRDALGRGLIIRTANGTPIQNPLVGIANKAMADMMRYCVEFGMTPSARSRVKAHLLATQKDPAEQFFG